MLVPRKALSSLATLMAKRIHLARNFLAAVAGFGFTTFAVGAFYAWSAAGQHGWSDLGYSWLALDYWSQLHEWKEGLAGAGLTFTLACIADLLTKKISAGRWIQTITSLAGRPTVCLVFLFVAYGLAPMAAKLTQPDAPANSPNVLFVLIDTWRADHAGFLGYQRPVSPGLDRLVAEGAVFETGVAQSGWTKPTVATLFTGLIPSLHGAVSQPIPGMKVHGTELPPDRTTFIEILRANGWDTAMWSNNPNILPHHGFAQGAGYFRSFVGESVGERFDAGRAEWMLPEVAAWLAERDSARPFCAYVHLMDPHYPYVAPKPFAGTFDQSGLDFQLNGTVIGEFLDGKRNIESVTPAMLQRIVDIYDEELLYIDYYLAPFLESVRQNFPNTIIVLVGDHGEEFLEHGQFGHGHSLYEELVHVPLVLLGPGIPAGFRTTQVARQMDVLPTLMELTGTTHDALLEAIQGESLVTIMAGATPNRLAPMESGGDQRPPWHWRGISDGDWKLLMRENDLPSVKPIPVLSEREQSGEGPWHMLFQLSKDPLEIKDISLDNLTKVKRLHQLFERRNWLFEPAMILQLGTSDGSVGTNLHLLNQLGYADIDQSQD